MRTILALSIFIMILISPQVRAGDKVVTTGDTESADVVIVCIPAAVE